MCGIIGYIGPRKNISQILVDGLKKLEYRGYDSAGICLNNGSSLSLTKRKGRIFELESALKDYSNFSNISDNSSDNLIPIMGIAHTRWATHGQPNEINAHPHLDSFGEIALVHNGIIENHHSLRKILEKEGVKLISETDSEVLVHLIRKFYDQDSSLISAVKKALKVTEGAYGIAVIAKDSNEMIVARKGSPLIIGLGEGENFVASDATAILDYTKRVIYLHDEEIARLTPNSYEISTLDGETIEKEVHKIKWNADQIEKNGYKHFMLKEIFEQPESISNMMRGRITSADGVKVTLNIPKNLGRIIVTACGTSWHSALIGKHLIEKIARIPVEVDYASEFRYRDPLIEPNDLVIAISQSGETADTLAAIKEAKSKGATTLGLVNVVGSTIARDVDSGIYLRAGPEIGVASTKAFTSQTLGLFLIACEIANLKGIKVDDKLFSAAFELPTKIESILNNVENIKLIAEEFRDVDNALYLGRGINFPVALEGALKLKEISYVHAEGYPAAEMKHGPIALIDEKMPVVFLAPMDDSFDKVLSNMQEVRARKGKIISIVDGESEKVSALSDYVIKVPKTVDILSPIINVVPLQLLAYFIADNRSIDVDRPRNLAKSVTVE